MSTSPNAALFERALRVVRVVEAENGRLKAERDLQRGEIALLRQRLDRLEQELAAERCARSELVEQVIDWLEQGEEIVRAGVSRVTRERPHAPASASSDSTPARGPDVVTSEPLAPGQTGRTSVLAEFATRLGGARERMGTAEFARTYGGRENPEVTEGLADRP